MKKDLNQKQNSFKIGFYGGVGDVTGANFLLEVVGLKILVDCGLIQGIKRDTDPNYQHSPLPCPCLCKSRPLPVSFLLPG